jgi:hypothetical protein
MGTIEETRQQITKELRWVSSVASVVAGGSDSMPRHFCGVFLQYIV